MFSENRTVKSDRRATEAKQNIAMIFTAPQVNAWVNALSGQVRGIGTEPHARTTYRELDPEHRPHAAKLAIGGWPEKDLPGQSIEISRLHNFPVAEKRGGCPRFGVGTWVLGSQPIQSTALNFKMLNLFDNVPFYPR
jgi:hypothetical protein